MSFLDNLTINLLNRSADMCIYAVRNTFPKENLQYAFTDNALYKPNHFVYKDGEILFVVTRSTSTPIDWQTDYDNEEVDATFGSRTMKAHRGFYYSGLTIYNHAKPYILKHNGPVIFTGTSLGGSMAGVLGHMALSDPNMKDRNINAIGFASAPSMEYVPEEYRKHIILLANHNDIVTRMNIPNMYDTYRDAIETGTFKEALLKDLNDHKVNKTVGVHIYNMTVDNIDRITETIYNYHKDKNIFKIRYL